jgi:PmbA protein
LERAHELVALANRAGAEEAEVFGLAGRSMDVDLRRDKVELASESFHQGLGLRAVIRGAVGFSSTSDMSKLNEVAASAIRAARARGPDECWQGLPSPEPVQRPDKVYDPAMEAIGAEDCLDLAADLLRGCAGVKGAEPVSGGVACISGVEFVVNSHGVELRERSTTMYAALEAIAKGDDVATGSEFHNSRLLCTELAGVGRAAGEMAVGSLGGSKAESGSFEILLGPIAFTDLLEHAFVPSLSADNVQKGRSALASRLGDKIASESLGIVDDGLLPGGMGASAFDGEGVPSRRSSIVESGVLKGFLYDSYTAGKAGISSTGNAVRSGYSEVPGVGIRNLIIGNGSSDLLEETRGILVNSLIGAHTANPISGDFSVEARNSFYIAPGEEPRPIRSMMLAGNIFDLLKGIDLGTDARMVGAVVTPTVRARIRVIGG